jgi:hypothetical protein
MLKKHQELLGAIETARGLARALAAAGCKVDDTRRALEVARLEIASRIVSYPAPEVTSAPRVAPKVTPHSRMGRPLETV